MPPDGRTSWTAAAARADCAGRSFRLDRNAEHVTFAVDGLDDARRAGVIAQDLAQPAHALIDAAIERIEIASAQQIHQLLARHHLTGLRQQDCEQPELCARQRHLCAVLVGERARRRIAVSYTHLTLPTSDL